MGQNNYWDGTKHVPISAPHEEFVINTTGGTANAITITTEAGYSYGPNKQLRFKAGFTNTGNVTINVDGEGVKPALKFDGTQLPAGSIKAGKVYDWYYDTASGGRFFLMAKASGNVVAGDVLAGKTFSSDDGEGTGTLALTGNADPGDVRRGKTFYKNDPKTILNGTFDGFGYGDFVPLSKLTGPSIRTPGFNNEFNHSGNISGMAVDDEAVYYACSWYNNQTISRLDRYTHTGGHSYMQWDGWSIGKIALTPNGDIVVARRSGLYARDLYCFAGDGTFTQKWMITVGVDIRELAVDSNENVYILTGNNVRSYTKSGSLRWDVALNLVTLMTLDEEGGFLYASGSGRVVFKVNISNGTQTNFGSTADSSGTISGLGVTSSKLVLVFNSRVHIFNKVTGLEESKFQPYDGYPVVAATVDAKTNSVYLAGYTMPSGNPIYNFRKSYLYNSFAWSIPDTVGLRMISIAPLSGMLYGAQGSKGVFIGETFKIN